MTENGSDNRTKYKPVDKELLNRLADQYIDMSRAQLRLLLNDPEQTAAMARLLRQSQQNFMDLFNLACGPMGSQNNMMPFGFGQQPATNRPDNENKTEPASDPAAKPATHTQQTAPDKERAAAAGVSPDGEQHGLSVLADRVEQLEKRLRELEGPAATTGTKPD